MRPLRFLLSLATCIVAFFLLLFIGPWRASTQESIERKSSIRSYLNWRTPSLLFPPTAVITLTDDNSTIFMARPAGFGPLLSKSLSGQLWIGSGFGDDRLGRTGSAEGELGCSDVPGWSDGNYRGAGKSLSEVKSLWAGSSDDKTVNHKRNHDTDAYDDEEHSIQIPDEDDGTDDYLHHPLPPSDGLKSNGRSAGITKKPTHADIQSLQESAEIDGKIVLLSRGGCGFLEKVKWAQRRGGIALIVGDDIRGEALVTMYARGDTSNVTIPSLFASHTTAHLLSGLVPSGKNAGGISLEEAERLGLAIGGQQDSGKADAQRAAADKPNFTTSTTTARPTSIQQQSHGKHETLSHHEHHGGSDGSGWLRSWFGGKDGKLSAADSRRPPNSGHMGWVLQQEFDDVDDEVKAADKHATTTSGPASGPTPDSKLADGFVIGVQDWRDPDLVAHVKDQFSISPSETSSSPTAGSTASLRGGSITPGSGEYAKAAHEPVNVAASGRADQLDKTHATEADSSRAPTGWLGRLFGSDDEPRVSTQHQSGQRVSSSSSRVSKQGRVDINDFEMHEGLWVTITPSSMSSSPFFDTLLVLVVSPLVTLTVVYALLLLRSRIRRRRWRAPKSVVEQLPVRTYQTMPSAASTGSTTSSIASSITATTPLLHSSARPINARPRPRSRTTSEVPVQAGSSLQSENSASLSPAQLEEKHAAGLAEWRRRYGGTQRECVVCLEEYIDGVSRVMSLPCGHEFHAECITPWLTTRRRTCPICKGDVVRSLARSGGSGPMTPPQGTCHGEEDADDIQEQAAVARNDDPSAARPVSREDEAFEDLEQGIGPDRSR